VKQEGDAGLIEIRSFPETGSGYGEPTAHIATEVFAMNKKMLARSVGRELRLRPFVIQYVVERGVPWWRRRSRRLDDPWFVLEANNDLLLLHNQRTHHRLPLPTDGIREYRHGVANDGFLLLRSQVFMEDVNVWLEPLVDRPMFLGASRRTNAETQL
jgi:hypothetical protein